LRFLAKKTIRGTVAKAKQEKKASKKNRRRGGGHLKSASKNHRKKRRKLRGERQKTRQIENPCPPSTVHHSRGSAGRGWTPASRLLSTGGGDARPDPLWYEGGRHKEQVIHCLEPVRTKGQTRKRGNRTNSHGKFRSVSAEGEVGNLEKKTRG